jgi:hypothetical protein
MGGQSRYESTLQRVTDVTDGQLESLAWGIHGAADKQLQRHNGMVAVVPSTNARATTN